MKLFKLRSRPKKFHVLLLKKRWWTAAICLVLAGAMFWVVQYPASVSAAATERQLPVYCVQRDQKMCALTFDAAWGADDTDDLISILGRYDVPATFFLVGDWVDRYPEEVKKLFDAGMEIGNHSNCHDHLPTLSLDAIAEDVTACNEKIAAITGVTPTLMRPPYGDYDDNCINAVRSLGMEAIQWDVEALAAVGRPWGHKGPAAV